MTNKVASHSYRTSDLTLAGALCVSGFLPIDVEWLTETRSVFVFGDQEEIAPIVEKYWAGALRVEPQSYWSQIKYLKARVRQS